MRNRPAIHKGIFAIFLVLALLATALLIRERFQSRPNPRLAFYDWEDDIPSSVIDAFTKETGIPVDYFTYESQEELVMNLRQGQRFDVVVIENHWIPKLREEGLLARIDLTSVPNAHNISANFRDLAFDPGSQYSIPYSWGTTGLIVQAEGAARPARFSELPEMDGKIGLRDQPRDIIGLTLLSLGHPANSEAPEHLAEAEKWLLTIQPKVVAVATDGDDGVRKLAAQEIAVLIGWGGDLIFAKRMDLPVSYILPQEGSIFWGDSFIIPRRNNGEDMAEIFLNFLLRPEVSAQIANHNGYPSANAAAYPFIAEDVKNDPFIYPDEQVVQQMLAHGEFLLPLSAAGETRYQNLWNRFMSGVAKTAAPQSMQEAQ